MNMKRAFTVFFALCFFIHASLVQVYGSECLSTTKYVKSEESPVQIQQYKEQQFLIEGIEYFQGKAAADALSARLDADEKKRDERRRIAADFNGRLAENTRTKIGNYEIYVASLTGSVLSWRVPDKGLSLVLEVRNATTNKILEGAESLARTSCDGEGKLAVCHTSPIWLVSDSYGNKLQPLEAATLLTQQLTPNQCDIVSSAYSITPLEGADLIINIPSIAFGVAGKLVIPKELINEWFHSN